MNKENTKKLFDRFKFYRPELSETVSLMCYGFECEDGWFDIIWDLSEKIEPFASDDFNVFQVKEKFGGLRFYTDGYTDEISAFIREAENKAENTCERCGKPSKIKSKNGWMSNVCCS